MIKQLLLSASAIALSFAALQSSAKAAIQFPKSCRMGSCYQATLNSKEALRSNEYGTLYLINTTTNLYPQTIYPDLAAQDYQRFVDFYGTDYVTKQSQQYIFCSTKIPTILFENDGEYIATRLALFRSPTTVDRGYQQIYLATCHNLAGPDYFSLAVQTLLIREGYTADSIEWLDQFKVPNVLEIMKLYPDRIETN